VSPLRGEKPQNWPLSKLNTGRFALRAMLPVIKYRQAGAARNAAGNHDDDDDEHTDVHLQCN